MSTGLHKDLANAEIHTVVAWVYADEAARLAATGFVAADLYKIAWQVSTGTLWVLESYSPISWTELASGSSPQFNKVEVRIIKDTAGTLTVGQAIRVATWDTGNDRASCELAKADSPSTLPCAGIVSVQATEASEGKALLLGILHDIDTSGLTALAPTYLSAATAGVVTTTPPNGPYIVQALGQCLKSHATEGHLGVNILSFRALSNSAPPNVTKAAAVAGTSNEGARQDHKHDVTTAAASAQVPGDSAAEGSATSLARSDHKHGLPAYGTGSGTICQGNDARLSDARAPAGSAGGDLAGSTYPNPTVAAAAITNAKLANMAQSTIKGRAAGAGAGVPVDLTATQATAILDAFTSALKGLVPASGGGTVNFLRADGTWAAPAPSPAVTEVSSTTTTTTTSAADVPVAGMTLTPAAGTYMVWFQGSIQNSAGAWEVHLSIYRGATRKVESVRRLLGYRVNDGFGFSCAVKVTVNGAEAITGQWQQVSGGTASCFERTLHVMKVA